MFVPLQDLNEDGDEEDSSSFYDSVMQCSGNFFKVGNMNAAYCLQL